MTTDRSQPDPQRPDATPPGVPPQAPQDAPPHAHPPTPPQPSPTDQSSTPQEPTEHPVQHTEANSPDVPEGPVAFCESPPAVDDELDTGTAFDTALPAETDLPDQLPPAITAALLARAGRTPPIPERVHRAVHAAAESKARVLRGEDTLAAHATPPSSTPPPPPPPAQQPPPPQPPRAGAAPPRHHVPAGRARRIWTPARLRRALAVAATLALGVTIAYVMLPPHADRGVRVAMQGTSAPVEVDLAVPMSVRSEAMPPPSAPEMARGVLSDAGPERRAAPAVTSAAPSAPGPAAPSAAPARADAAGQTPPLDVVVALRLALELNRDAQGDPMDHTPSRSNAAAPPPAPLPEQVEALLAGAVLLEPVRPGTEPIPRRAPSRARPNDEADPISTKGVPEAEALVGARTLWLILDAAPARPAAWQVELRLTDHADRIVGVFPGPHAAFSNTLRFDPLAINGPRIILAGLSTAPTQALPAGPTPVARILVAHALHADDPNQPRPPDTSPDSAAALPSHTLRLLAAGDERARPITARAWLSLRPEDGPPGEPTAPDAP